MAKFLISTAFPIASRQLYVLAGEVLEGEVEAGMTVYIPFNPAVRMTEQIQAVEKIHHDGREQIGLCLPYEEDIGLQVWEAFEFSDEIVEVS